MPVAHEIIQEFLVETYDGLGRLDVELVELEKGQAKADTLGSVFRTIHSLKGSAGFLGFGKLEALTHVAESLLSKLRDGKLVVSVAIVSALLATVDAVREMLRTIEASGQDGSQEYPELVARLKALTVPEPAKNGAATSTGNSTASSTALVDLAAILNQPAAVMPKPPVEKPAVQQPVAFEDQTQTISVALAKLASQPAAKVPVGKPGRVQSWDAMEVSGKALAAGPDALPAASAVPLKITPAGYPLQPQFEPGQKPLSDSRTGSDSNVRLSDSSHEATAAHVVSPRASDSTIRLSIERVDKMMNLVTELVLSRNQIMQHPLIQANSVLALASRNLNLITSELQESVMRMRMQPINNVWGTLPRVVRDLSLGCGKQVRLVLEGAETELDKSVLDAIKDPLMHLVRNAIDHGFETPDVRQSSGKPVEGCLRLRAYHESGHVHIEITDDGAGIDPAKIKAKARERNLLSVEQAEQLSDESVLSLIFLPGFSTKEAVSNLSGRGVGMDVVKSYVERIGGQVDVHSIVGVGSSFELRIPLTLAIIHALMVSSGGERYAVPQTSMIELIRLDGEKMKSGIEHIHGVRVHRYRGKLLPLVSLTQMLEGSEVEGLESVNIIVLQAHQQQFGLIVDRVHDTQEIVVKPLHKLLRGIACLAGATILGDGEVALILDVVGLAERALGEARTHSVGLTEGTPEPAATAEDVPQMVLVSGLRGERLAVPLSSVARLEVVPATKVEWSGSRPVIQYRNQILPLVDLMGLLERNANFREGEAPAEPRVVAVLGSAGASPSRIDGGSAGASPSRIGLIHVVVCTDGTSSVGLVVGQILDIVSDPLEVRSNSAREHVLFTAVVQRQVTDVLDVASLIASAVAEPIGMRGQK